MRRILVLLALPCTLAAQIKIMVHLAPATNQAFDKYVAAAESKMDGKPLKPSGDLTAIGGSPINVEGGMIHDWVGGVLVKGGSVEKALAMFEDYAAYKKTFGPEVIDFKLLSHDGDRWTTALRISPRNVFTVTFDTEYAIQYRKLEGGRWAIDSRSTRISELDDDNKPLPGDASQGFLWRREFVLAAGAPSRGSLSGVPGDLAFPRYSGWIGLDREAHDRKRASRFAAGDHRRGTKRLAVSEDPPVPQPKVDQRSNADRRQVRWDRRDACPTGQ